MKSKLNHIKLKHTFLPFSSLSIHSLAFACVTSRRIEKQNLNERKKDEKTLFAISILVHIIVWNEFARHPHTYIYSTCSCASRCIDLLKPSSLAPFGVLCVCLRSLFPFVYSHSLCYFFVHSFCLRIFSQSNGTYLMCRCICINFNFYPIVSVCVLVAPFSPSLENGIIILFRCTPSAPVQPFQIGLVFPFLVFIPFHPIPFRLINVCSVYAMIFVSHHFQDVIK